MAPGSISSWRRPHTSIYNDNYRYGSSLYSDTLTDIQKKKTDPLSKAQLSSACSGNSAAAKSSSLDEQNHPKGSNNSTQDFDAKDEYSASTYQGSIFESMLNTALHSSYATDEGKKTTKHLSSSGTPAISLKPTSLYDEAGLFITLPKMIARAEIEPEGFKSTKKRRDESSVIFDERAQCDRGLVSRKNKFTDLKNQADVVTQDLANMASKLNGEILSLKEKIHSEAEDLQGSLKLSNTQNHELQRTVKKQASHLMELQCGYEALQHRLQDFLEEVDLLQKRNQAVLREMDKLSVEE